MGIERGGLASRVFAIAIIPIMSPLGEMDGLPQAEKPPKRR